MKTKIEWADRVWNPIIGCSPAGAGCKNCYAARMATRLAANPKTPAYHGLAKGGKWTGDFVMLQDRLRQPGRWHKPCRVFVNSMSDLFHPEIPDEWVDDVLETIRRAIGWAYDHTYMILTKRPERLFEKHPLTICGYDQSWSFADRFEGVNNLWLGVSVWDQQSADTLIPLLLQVPAAVRFVSYEPALGPVDFSSALGIEWSEAAGRYLPEQIHILGGHPRVDWIICGPETGPRARTFMGNWARTVRDQCAAADVPFFFKGWPAGYIPDTNNYQLDGRQWKQFPKVKK